LAGAALNLANEKQVKFSDESEKRILQQDVVAA